MRILILIFWIGLFCVSCAVQKPAHIIYGEWESVESPKVILKFDENNLLKSETLRANGTVYKFDYDFKIIDTSSVKFSDDSLSDGARAEVTAKVEADNVLKINCIFGKHTDGRNMTDPPNICLYKEFRRLK